MARDEVGVTLRSPEVILGRGPVSGASGDVDFISGHVCDRTPSLGGPTVRQEATCVAAASGPCR